MTSIHAVAPANYACDKCKKPATLVDMDSKGTVTAARCDEHIKNMRASERLTQGS